MAQFRALNVRCQLEQMVVQVLGVYLVVYVGCVVEEHLHHTLVVLMAFLESIVGSASLRVPLMVLDFLCLAVHVPHVVFRRVVAYAKLWIQALQLLQGILHREDAAYHHGALGVDVGHALENLGESLIHAVSYFSMLLGTQ